MANRDVYYESDNGWRLRSSFSGDDLLVAAVIFLVFCIICLVVWVGSPVRAQQFAAQRQEQAVRRHVVVLGDILLDTEEEIETPRGNGVGDIRERIHDEVEEEEQQARQDAGEPELDATERIRTAVEEHFREMTAHANDGQNVHDQVIVKNHALKYRRMLELRIKDKEHKEFVARLIAQGYKVRDIRGMETDQAFREIRAHAKQYVTDTERLQRINTVLDGIGRGDTSVSLTGRPVKDIWVLTLIWKRIHHRDNETNAEDMRGILMDQLFDAASDTGGLLDLGTGTVCIGGRIGRMMSVLTRMDADEVLTKPELDVKELTNEASSKCAQLVKKITEENPTLAALYAKLPEELNAKQKLDVGRFEEKIRKRIEENLRADYKDLLSEREMNKLIATMQAGI